MTDKLAYLMPEITLFITTCIVMVVGLSPRVEMRRLCAWITGAGLLLAGGIAANTPEAVGTLFPHLMGYAKVMIACVGMLLLLVAAGVVDRDLEALVAAGKTKFNPLRATRAEYYAFFLFSLTGLMLVTSADDLIWLFLALELTSLPTYIMVTISTRRTRSQEAGVKYFFLGALGAAIFLYGFALIYGASGSTDLGVIAASFAEHGLNPIAKAGLVLSFVGVSFKIAAVPMHFYTPDVYEGAASPVSAFLAFVPKTAGFIAIFLLCGLVGWGFGEHGGELPGFLAGLVWVIAALTMTVGNVLALLQDSVKRMMAYSSIAHSGYMLVGVLAGPGRRFAEDGLAAVLFYLLCYGVMNLGVFAVIASLEKKDGSEPERFDELRGLVRSHPVLGWTVVVCSLSMLGFPPLLGFFGKFGLFSSGVSAGLVPLVVILGINSAVAAFYYLRLVATVYLEPRGEGQPETKSVSIVSRPIGAVLSACGVIGLLLVTQPLLERAHDAAAYNGVEPAGLVDDAGERDAIIEERVSSAD